LKHSTERRLIGAHFTELPRLGTSAMLGHLEGAGSLYASGEESFFDLLAVRIA
jgi:hypothetical protein